MVSEKYNWLNCEKKLDVILKCTHSQIKEINQPILVGLTIIIVVLQNISATHFIFFCLIGSSSHSSKTLPHLGGCHTPYFLEFF
jgi:hypothetical protein